MKAAGFCATCFGTSARLPRLSSAAYARWVMCAELVETSRLWGRVAAKIEPEWAEALAEHLVKRHYSEPHWEKKQAAVVAYEKVTLYGLPIVVKRKVNYGRIDPVLSRELFIRQALVEGEWDTRHKFFHDNRKANRVGFTSTVLFRKWQAHDP